VTANVRFSGRELRDLALAWVALSVAFALFFAGGGTAGVRSILRAGVVLPVVVSLVTAGVGFLLHELAHKVVAVRFDQVAEFRADYGMLFLAVMTALVGFIFAAPGAVYHRGRVTGRQLGLIALAGPVTNLLLSALFLPLYLAGVVLGLPLVTLVGGRGLAINLFLAAFNLLPIGSLDGATVRKWSTPVYLAAFVPSLVATVLVVFVAGIGL
jgi:Zn-dependent protease